MELRREQEEWENSTLSEFAAKSCFSKGREKEEEKCDIRTDFQRDRDRIIHSKAFRRMKHKTQVFISPEGDHYRTRLTHTLEVSQIARTIARALKLNEDLTEAIALGHDLGHTPFGHSGESVLNKICSFGFEHSEQSIRVVERLEKDGAGLNLTWEVKDGILNHRTKGKPETLEGKVVQLSDKIAYINHDIDDAIRAGILRPEDIPKKLVKIIGDTGSKRIDTLIRETVISSYGTNEIKMGNEMHEAMSQLRQFMFKNVYNDSRAEQESVRVKRLIGELFKYFMANPYEPENEFAFLIDQGENEERIVCDFIACMTDRYAVSVYKKLFIPSSWDIY